MNYFWIIENIDKADIKDLRCALKETLKEKERLERANKVLSKALGSKGAK